MFNMPTSGPLSPTVSLERRKLEQQGIPPGQEQPGSAAKGSPISGDLAQLIQLNRMLQQQGTMQQQANAAPSTVAQDLMQQVTQQRAPQMQPQMPPQMPQMPPQMDPRQQGIAQLPQEAVGNGMAAGGIVAFDDGGSVRHFADGGLTNQEKAELAKLEMLHTAVLPAYGAGYDAEMDKQQTQARYQELRARQKAAEQEPVQSAGNFNMVQDAMKRNAAPAAPAPDNVKRVIDAARAARPSRDEGLAEFVPTLSYSKRNPLDLAVENAGFDLQKDYGKIRKKMEEESGLAGIWKKQQAEQDRLKAEVNPEARKKAFYNNLAEQLAGQIGQRGVSTSSRLAQMVGAYGATRSTTDKETKKLEAELNKASNDLQEKQAMYRMTGTMADRESLAKANKEYETAAIAKQTAERLEKKDAIAERRFDEDRDLRKEQLAQQGSLGQGQLALGYAALGGRTAQAAAALASRAQAQQVKDRKDAMTWFDKNVGEDEVRKKVAASPQFKKYSKMPVNEKVFQDAVAAEKERMMLDYLASIYQIPKEQPVPHSVMGPVSIAGE